MKDKNRIKGLALRCVFLLPLFTLVFFLASCSRVHKDGPPSFYVDESKVPNAVPKAEPLSKYGNLKTYRVFGKRYYTLPTSKNFEEVGVASWYGTQFHSRRTSSGERYNMLAMTAAHKTLPLPTYVEVTNLKNSRKIIVKVNDRGPFESNRIIDLSYVAAKKLDMLGHGTAMVRIKAIDPYTFGKTILIAEKTKSTTTFKTPAARAEEKRYPSFWVANKTVKKSFTAVNTRSHTQPYYVQVGAFRNKLQAEKLKNSLRSRLLTTEIKVALTAPKLYRVKIGPIKDVATAKKVSHQLKRLGLASNRTYH